MSEPKATASKTVEVLPGIHRWWVNDDRIGGVESDAFAVMHTGKVTLIDPLPLTDGALEALGPVEAVVLSAGNHQRSAWALRAKLHVPVFAPRGALGLVEKPDSVYESGDALPGGLVAFHTPGPVESMHALWTTTPVRTVFAADLLTHDGNGNLSFVASKYQEEPGRTRASVRRILETLDPDALFVSHGPPLLKDVSAALSRALKEDPEHLSSESGVAAPR